MGSDWLPSNDAQLIAKLRNAVNLVTVHAADWGVAEDVPAVQAALELYEQNYAAHITEQASARAARIRKDEARAGVEKLIRALAKRLVPCPAVSDGDLQALGFPVPKMSVSNPLVPTWTGPSTRPVIEIEEQEGLRHVVRLADSETGRAAKPAGVHRGELYLNLSGPDAPPPADPAQMQLVANATGTTKVLRQFDGTQAGKTAWYMARWVDKRGNAGPWSTLARATVAA